MIKSSSDGFFPLIQKTPFEQLFSQFTTGNQIIFDISGGIIVSLIIYILVVCVPERSKRNLVRKNLKRQYNLFKEDCINVFLSVLKEPCKPELVDRLKNRDEFRAFFKEPVSSSQNRWDAVLNGLDEYYIKRLLVELEILMAEIHYTLSTIDIENEEAFAFLKRISHAIYRNRDWSAEYDSVKQLSSFMWSVHTGWSIIHGYTGKDVIADMIDAI